VTEAALVHQQFAAAIDDGRVELRVGRRQRARGRRLLSSESGNGRGKDERNNENGSHGDTFITQIWRFATRERRAQRALR
jgi:hypothetical protein